MIPQAPPLPLTQDLVLIGGGHTHALVLRKWAMDPLPGARLTVINPGPTAPYSGMLPGCVAGHYKRAELDIDLSQLARAAGARLVLGAAHRIDTAARQVHVAGRPPIGFDVASIDIGITSAMPDLPGFSNHGIGAKPLGPFATRWQAHLEQEGATAIAVLGGGVAGAELALAMAHALRTRGRSFALRLIDRSEILTALSPRAQRVMHNALRAAGVEVLEHCAVQDVSSEGLRLADGQQIPSDFTLGAAGAKPHDWLSTCGLATEAGFLTVNAQLQTSDPAIFAVGDCAHMRHAPRPKAGVYAVRQAPVLYQNLRALLKSDVKHTARLQAYQPQRDYLKLISLGTRRALLDRNGMALAGGLLWRWKDHIDQRFMQQFRRLPAMAPPAQPRERAAGVDGALDAGLDGTLDGTHGNSHRNSQGNSHRNSQGNSQGNILGEKPLCGGCGAKVGRGALRSALQGVTGATRDDHLRLPGDDAAALQIGGQTQVLSTDHLRAVTEDPVLHTNIALQHALNDLWAMGADAQGALVSVTLPRMSAKLQSRMMTEIMATVDAGLRAAGAALLGGHSSVGAELTLGFTVTGLCRRAPITLAGARPGDQLLLSKPIGSGTLLAGHMAGHTSGALLMQAFEAMQHSQKAAATVLQDARAMTDVTGFGLLGHLQGICEASGVGAELRFADVPLLPGAAALAAAGIRSSLYPENRALAPDLPDDGAQALLFDPQTAGGLLAAVPPEVAETRLRQLRDAGYDAALIGQITQAPPQITLR